MSVKRMQFIQTVSATLFFFSGVTVTRGCCRTETNSPVCPPGADSQTETVNESYYYYYTRCETDFCNDTDGTDTRGEDVSETLDLGRTYASGFQGLLLSVFSRRG